MCILPTEMDLIPCLDHSICKPIEEALILQKKAQARVLGFSDVYCASLKT